MGSLVFADLTDNASRAASLPISSALSMSGWANLDSVTLGALSYIMQARTGAQGYGIALNSSNELRLYTPSGSTSLFSAGISAAVWNYFAISRTSDTVYQSYIWNASGTLIATADSTGDTFTQDPVELLVMNGSSSVNQSALGKAAYWKVWDEGLSQAQFEAEMFSPIVVRTTNFNTGFADSATDIGPNGRDWTLTGTTTDSDTPPVRLGGRLPLLGVG
jgi:hypothetical protein